MTIKSNINKWIAGFAISFLFIANGCTSSFDDINTNPDATTTVTPAMLATKLLIDIVPSANSQNSELCCKRLFWGEQIDYYQYNSFGKGSFSNIQNLINAQKMVELAADVDQDAYAGLFYFLKGWIFYHTTMEMGDIPYNEALNIKEFRYPKYDEQKDIFAGILSDLAKANEHFSKASSFRGDPFYKGDPTLWRKATNVFRLKVLMSLQKRAEDTPELKIQDTFAEIVRNCPLFENNSDNLQVVYSDKKGQQNPSHETNTKSINVYAGSKTIIDPLKEFNDYRLFYYFAPMQAMTDPLYLPKGETLLEKNDWNAYQGMDVSAPFAEEQKKITQYYHCRPNDVYRLSYVGVPSICLGYADMNFILAEAAERGWISGSAKQYYNEGIRASFLFVRTTVPDEYNNGVTITDKYIEDYITSDKVIYKENATSTDRLHQIWLQSYLASFLHLAWDSYFDYRRTGYPKLPINPETNLNDAKDKIPVRWLYPDGETNYNKEQLNIALERQWGGVDNVNKLMWVIK